MRPQALYWLSALYIALRRLPIALVWLPTTRFFISRAPNMITRLDVELQPLHRLPVLAPSSTYRPVLAPYTGSHNSGLHLKNYRLEVDLQPQTFYSPAHLKDSKLEVELQPLHRLPVLHIAIRWLHTQTPYIRFYLNGSHKDIFKNETPIHIPNFICFQEIIST